MTAAHEWLARTRLRRHLRQHAGDVFQVPGLDDLTMADAMDVDPRDAMGRPVAGRSMNSPV
jgi:hypothetical protein